MHIIYIIYQCVRNYLFKSPPYLQESPTWLNGPLFSEASIWNDFSMGHEPNRRIKPVPAKMSLEMIIENGIRALIGHHRSRFKWHIRKQRWILTTQDFDFHPDDHLESHLFANRLYETWTINIWDMPMPFDLETSLPSGIYINTHASSNMYTHIRTRVYTPPTHKANAQYSDALWIWIFFRQTEQVRWLLCSTCIWRGGVFRCKNMYQIFLMPS